MNKQSAEGYLDKLLNSVNDEKVKKDKFKETAKILEDAMNFWENDADDSDFEEAEYKQEFPGKGKASGQEDFLDSLLSGKKNTIFGMNRRRTDTNPMYSKRVSRSEVDFLREFEAELASEGEELLDLFSDFVDEVETSAEDQDEVEPQNEIKTQNEEEIQNEIEIQDNIDISSLLEGAAAVMGEEPNSINVLDVFLGGEENADMPEIEPVEVRSEGIDLGNLGEEDLMNLLSGADGLSDIGDLLSKSEATELSLEDMDAFEIFAEGEMAVNQTVEEAPLEQKAVQNDGKKEGFFGSLKSLVGKLLKDYDEVELKPAKEPTAENLSNENAEILAELEEADKQTSNKKKEKKEKKPKKKKEPKEPKPKKEKKPKEVDNTPPLPKGPVIMIFLMVVSMVVLVLLGVSLIRDNSAMASAKGLHNQGHYAEAYSSLRGIKIKERDVEFYNQLSVLASADSEWNAYVAFSKTQMKDKALDSLICAAGRCHVNEENAERFGCLGELELLKKTIANELEQNYSMSYDKAIEMYSLEDRGEYTIALYKKLLELGINLE